MPYSDIPRPIEIRYALISCRATWVCAALMAVLSMFCMVLFGWGRPGLPPRYIDRFPDYSAYFAIFFLLVSRSFQFHWDHWRLVCEGKSAFIRKIGEENFTWMWKRVALGFTAASAIALLISISENVKILKISFGF